MAKCLPVQAGRGWRGSPLCVTAGPVVPLGDTPPPSNQRRVHEQVVGVLVPSSPALSPPGGKEAKRRPCSPSLRAARRKGWGMGTIPAPDSFPSQIVRGLLKGQRKTIIPPAQRRRRPVKRNAVYATRDRRPPVAHTAPVPVRERQRGLPLLLPCVASLLGQEHVGRLDAEPLQVQFLVGAVGDDLS